MPEVLLMSEVSERIRVPVNTLRFCRHQGTGPRSFRLGGRVMYAAEDVDRWTEEQRSVGVSGGGPE